MRITGGLYKGRRVKMPKGEIRPAMDRMRESFFSILGPLNGYSFLDIFSGSGIIGIEAASRGANPVQLVERDRIKKRVILENISFVEENIFLRLQAAETFLKNNRQSYDIVFLDPPFKYRDKTSLLEKVAYSASISEGSRVLIHYPSENNIPEKIGALERYDHRSYGRSQLDFFINPLK